MFAISNLIILAARLIEIFLQMWCFMIILRAFISWVNPDPFHPLVQFLNRMTDPVLAPFRKFMPPLGPIDISPMIAVILIYSVQKYFLVPTLMELAMRMR
ncbi:MAG: YggT family protein [Candidatus Omnitrophica bacterium]|nr:YggT family protein [Candidatus Omnitrophota bacterium]